MERTVNIGFDDAKRSVFENAYPILEEKNLTATVYVITDRIGEEGYMDREMLVEVADAGWETGAHTRSHPRLREQSNQRVIEEFETSKAVVESILADANTNQERIGIAYPFGKYSAIGIREAVLCGDRFDYGRVNCNRRENGEQVIETPINEPPYKRTLLRARNPYEKGFEDYEHNLEALDDGWLILYYHGIHEDTSPDIDEYRRICEHLSDLQVMGQISVINPVTVLVEQSDRFRDLFSEDRRQWVESEDSNRTVTATLRQLNPF